MPLSTRFIYTGSRPPPGRNNITAKGTGCQLVKYSFNSQFSQLEFEIVDLVRKLLHGSIDKQEEISEG